MKTHSIDQLFGKVECEADRSYVASPVRVKEVRLGERRYIVCLNEDQREKDAADREAILVSLREKLKQGDKALVGNHGYRKYLTRCGPRFEIDVAAVEREARYDGKWVLRTNTGLAAAEVALKYKELWTVEALFRSAQSLLETRSVFHRCDEAIRGHVFCSFLALVLRKELQERLTRHGDRFEWVDILRDLAALTETEITHAGKRFGLRSEARGTCGRVFQAVGGRPRPPQSVAWADKGVPDARLPNGLTSWCHAPALRP